MVRKRRASDTRHATIADIARQTGLSMGAVSQILSGKRGGRPENVAKIQNAINRLGYRSNLIARHLALGKTNTIGLVFYFQLIDIFNAHLLWFVEKCVRSEGYDLTPSNLFETYEVGGLSRSSSVDDLDFLSNLLERRVEGIIAQGYILGRTAARELFDAGIQLCVWEPEEALPVSVSVVRVDYSSIMPLAIDHLVRLGHRNISLLAGMEDFAAVRDSVNAFSESMARHGIDSTERIFYSGSTQSEDAGRDVAMNTDLHENSTAIICGDDRIAIGLLSGYAERGISIPEELSVVGTDDMFYAAYAYPPLTTIRINVEDAAKKLFDGLMHSMKHKEGMELLCGGELIIRKSTDVPRR